ncbi:MAG: hypothetical protein ACE5K0_11760 [Candidatus Methanofastidiosia archaeon]
MNRKIEEKLENLGEVMSGEDSRVVMIWRILNIIKDRLVSVSKPDIFHGEFYQRYFKILDSQMDYYRVLVPYRWYAGIASAGPDEKIYIFDGVVDLGPYDEEEYKRLKQMECELEHVEMGKPHFRPSRVLRSGRLPEGVRFDESIQEILNNDYELLKIIKNPLPKRDWGEVLMPNTITHVGVFLFTEDLPTEAFKVMGSDPYEYFPKKDQNMKLVIHLEKYGFRRMKEIVPIMLDIAEKIVDDLYRRDILESLEIG